MLGLIFILYTRAQDSSCSVIEPELIIHVCGAWAKQRTLWRRESVDKRKVHLEVWRKGVQAQGGWTRHRPLKAPNVPAFNFNEGQQHIQSLSMLTKKLRGFLGGVQFHFDSSTISKHTVKMHHRRSCDMPASGHHIKNKEKDFTRY